MPKSNRICEACGKDFYASPGHINQGWGRYCSMSCRSSAYGGAGNPRWAGSDAGNCTCLSCGKQFRVKPSRKSDGEGKYCSQQCKSKSYPVKPTFQCEHCKKDFQIQVSQLKKEKVYRFCSIECRVAYNSARTNCTCVQCGTEFYTKISDLNRASKKGVGKFCSMECKARWMSSHASCSGKARSHGGKRSDINGIYFRSSWEANYARYLNWLISNGEIVSWEFEAETFEFSKIKRGSKFYTPDFKIVNQDRSVEFHEIKGYMDPKSITKIKRMGRYFPKIKLVVIDSDSYKKLSRDVRKMIPNWESDL